MLSFLKFGASHHDEQSVTALRKRLLAAEAVRAQSEDIFVEALRSIICLEGCANGAGESV